MREERVEIERTLEGRSSSQDVWRRLLPSLASIGALIGLWQWLTASGITSPILLPLPKDVVAAVLDFREPLVDATLRTLGEVLLGFGAAILGAMILAIALSYSRVLSAALYPPLVFLHSIPKAAIAPILLIWLGFGLTHKVVVSFLVALFPIAVALTSGLGRVDPDLHDLTRSLHSSRIKTFWKVDLPFALPMFFAGLRVGVTLAVVGAVVAEFVAGDAGLAFLLQSASANHLTPLAFGCALILSLMSAALFGLVVLAEHRFVSWNRPGAGNRRP